MPDAAFVWIESRDTAVDAPELASVLARRAGRGSPSRLTRTASVVAPPIIAIVAFQSLVSLLADTWPWLRDVANHEYAGFTKALTDWQEAGDFEQQLRRG